MPNNRIEELLRGRNIREFARANGINEQTLYKICKKKTLKDVSIDVFLKIAHGLGMSAEELYYGYVDGEHGNEYSDDRQRDANDVWEHVSEEYRAQMVSHVQTIEKAYRYEIEHATKDGSEW